MILFVSIAAAMVVVALLWVIVPLLRPARHRSVEREASNVAILRDQLVELDADLANGTLQQEQYESARRELEARVLEESKSTLTGGAVRPSSAGAYTAAILGAALPIAAAVLYFMLGSYQALAPGAGAASAAAGNNGQHDLSPDKVAQMAANLAAKLEKEPDNAQGWLTLAHTYYSMRRFREAVSAYEHAVKLVPDDADVLADYADALGAANQSLAGKPAELVQRALAVNPGQWKALALAGTIAFDQKDYKQAVVYWDQLKDLLPPDSEIARSVEGSIAEARSLGNLPAPAAGAKTLPSAKAAMAGPAQKGTSAAVPGATVSGEVSLSPALAKGINPDDLVFVLARSSQGSKMPLAILRKQVKDLPFKFALDDSMAVSPDMKLSNVAEIIVVARVSKTGNVMPTSGDLEGTSKPAAFGTQGIKLVIDSKLP